MPRPTLAQESGQKRGVWGEDSPFSPINPGVQVPSVAPLNFLQAWAQNRRDWFDTRAGSSCAVFCTLSLHTPLPTVTHNCQARGVSMAHGWLIGKQPVTRPVAWPRKMSGPPDSSLGCLNQETQWENCQLAGKPEPESWESCQDVEGAGQSSGAWKSWSTQRMRLACEQGGQTLGEGQQSPSYTAGSLPPSP